MKRIIQLSIFIYSAILFLIAFFTNQTVDENLFRWITGVSSVIVLIYGAFDKWAWRWPLSKKLVEFTGKPIIYGTWQGTLEYKRDGQGNSGKTDIYIAINQTFSSVNVTAFVTTSESYSVVATIEKAKSGKRELIYFYRSSAPIGSRDNNRPHEGVAILNILGTPVNELIGSYFTERRGEGSLKLRKKSSKLAESYEEAKRLKYK